MRFRQWLGLALTLIGWAASSCALHDDGAPKKSPSSGFIATPPSYYSTQKARYLGTKYKENLERLVVSITRDPKTAPLQFANNISSVGGIGFFTHSATKTPDERYLEVVLATPETFETKGGYSEKVARLFVRYGAELLTILGGDREIYQDKELSGYGLNLAWRTVIAEGHSNRVAMARAVVYFHKERVVKFLRQEINANDLLANAVIFAVEEDGPLQLVSYKPQQAHPDYRPAIREDNLASAPANSKPNPAVASSKSVTEITSKAEASPETKPAPVTVAEASTDVRTERSRPSKSEATAKAPAAKPEDEKKDEKVLPPPPVTIAKTVRTEVPIPDDAESKKLALNQKRESAAPPAASKAAPEEAKHDQATPKIPSEIAVKPPASERLQSAEEHLEKLAKPAVTASNPRVELTKDQPMAAAVAKRSELAPAIAAEPRREQSTDFKPAETVAAPAAKIKPLNPTNVSEKAAIAEPVAKLESRDNSPKQSATASSQIHGFSALEKNLPAPASKSNPPPLAPPASKQPDREKASVPVPETRAIPNAAEPEAQAAKLPEIKKEETSAVAPSAVSQPSGPVSPSTEAAAPIAVNVPKSEPSSNSPAVVEAPVPDAKKSTETPAPEQLASLKKTPESIIENKTLARPVPKPLEGFIIQIAFNDKEKAQSWAEKMEHRGYAVSVTTAGNEGSLRVRLGNFAGREEAERQLNNLKSDGMKGIIINLPQAFRPEARSSVP